MSLFLAGGITGCPDWQSYVIGMLSDTSLVLLNPRRSSFDVGNLDVSEQQIRWEFRHLRIATARLFWFPEETLCPIALLELGNSLATGVPLFVGVHPEYARLLDIRVQCRLYRPDVKVVTHINALCGQVVGNYGESGK